MTLLPQLPAVAWALLATAALIVGFSKTALPGVNTISIAIFAAILPARHSTGALLVLLIVGDAFAVWAYRKHASWPTILRLAPAVVGGLALGAVFLALADDSWVRRVIGIILLLVVGFTVWRRWISSGGAPAGRAASIGYGSLGGFTTMVANAGGPVMSMYFLAARFPVKAFLGTAAWFFACINLAKLPFSIGLGLIDAGSLVLDLLLVPGVIIGALLGRWAANRMRQGFFDVAVLGATVLGAVYLLI
ncbi:sulfite exporter TauE/SafE family protein [Leucobacter allii]|uniref:Probable membrane transporter protein n=1 Tax=Leucobacter allii TaxID=2932247 RepID=A0ABY4FLG2_9MICO|nr:sulfite exporter TauE/SafE family protein [Leucobacter allii]UOQ57114.1 sulfite exporter TauE/SafE family protein [Leucobacter allii]UOR01624.1 sulfite exporter TauE/SafE family protein [Leucobacter allii]